MKNGCTFTLLKTWPSAFLLRRLIFRAFTLQRCKSPLENIQMVSTLYSSNYVIFIIRPNWFIQDISIRSLQWLLIYLMTNLSTPWMLFKPLLKKWHLYPKCWVDLSWNSRLIFQFFLFWNCKPLENFLKQLGLNYHLSRYLFGLNSILILDIVLNFDAKVLSFKNSRITHEFQLKSTQHLGT